MKVCVGEENRRVCWKGGEKVHLIFTTFGPTKKDACFDSRNVSFLVLPFSLHCCRESPLRWECFVFDFHFAWLTWHIGRSTLSIFHLHLGLKHFLQNFLASSRELVSWCVVHVFLLHGEVMGRFSIGCLKLSLISFQTWCTWDKKTTHLVAY